MAASAEGPMARPPRGSPIVAPRSLVDMFQEAYNEMATGVQLEVRGTYRGDDIFSPLTVQVPPRNPAPSAVSRQLPKATPMVDDTATENGALAGGGLGSPGSSIQTLAAALPEVGLVSSSTSSSLCSSLDGSVGTQTAVAGGAAGAGGGRGKLSGSGGGAAGISGMASTIPPTPVVDPMRGCPDDVEPIPVSTVNLGIISPLVGAVSGSRTGLPTDWPRLGGKYRDRGVEGDKDSVALSSVGQTPHASSIADEEDSDNSDGDDDSVGNALVRNAAVKRPDGTSFLPVLRHYRVFTGNLWKRSSGTRPLGLESWRERFFVLAQGTLAYYRASRDFWAGDQPVKGVALRVANYQWTDDGPTGFTLTHIACVGWAPRTRVAPLDAAGSGVVLAAPDPEWAAGPALEECVYPVVRPTPPPPGFTGMVFGSSGGGGGGTNTGGGVVRGLPVGSDDDCALSPASGASAGADVASDAPDERVWSFRTRSLAEKVQWKRWLMYHGCKVWAPSLRLDSYHEFTTVNPGPDGAYPFLPLVDMIELCIAAGRESGEWGVL